MENIIVKVVNTISSNFVQNYVTNITCQFTVFLLNVFIIVLEKFLSI